VPKGGYLQIADTALVYRMTVARRNWSHLCRHDRTWA